MTSLNKGILLILIANIVNLSLSVIRNFLMPYYLSIETYASIKTYQLYTSYVSLLACGYIDGAYLKYGGRMLIEINKNEFSRETSTFRIMQLLASVVVSFLGIYYDDYLLILTGLSIVFINIIDYYKCLLQAFGEFGLYSRLSNINSIVLFVVIMTLLIIFGVDNPFYYIVAFFISYMVVCIGLEYFWIRIHNMKFQYYFSKELFLENVGSGFTLMCGLWLSNLLLGIDRWFIKVLMSSYNFAMYSFSASMEGFLNYATSPVSITLFNHMCNEHTSKEIYSLKRMILLFSLSIISLAYGIKFIVDIFIPKYSSSLGILFVLFASQAIIIIIKCFYINLYKSRKNQKKYFNRIIYVVIFSVLSNILFYGIYNSIYSFAVATLVTSLFWYILCNIDFKEFTMTLNEACILMISLIGFVFLGININGLLGFIIYWTILITMSKFLFKDEFDALTFRLLEYKRRLM